MLKFKNFLKQLNEQTYKEKFAALLKDMGVSSVKELSPEQKKKLFSKMDAIHTSKAEKKAMTEMMLESLTEANMNYTEFKVGDPVEICDGDHKGSCGKIESHDDSKTTFIVNLNGKKMAFPRFSFVPFFGGAFYGGAGSGSSGSGEMSGGEGGAVGAAESYIEKFVNIICEENKFALLTEDFKSKEAHSEVVVCPRLFEQTTVMINAKIRQAKSLMTESSIFVVDFVKSSEMFESAEVAEAFLKDQFASVFIVEGTKEYPVYACMTGQIEEKVEDISEELAPGQEVTVVGDKWVNNSKKGVVVGHMPVTGVFYNVRFPDGTMAIYDASSISKAEAEGVAQVQAEEKIEEGFVNHRELACANMMHDSMAKHMSVGKEMDFYSCKDGEKVSGKVQKNDGETIEMKQDDGTIHKFKVTAKSKIEEAVETNMHDHIHSTVSTFGGKVAQETHSRDGSPVPGMYAVHASATPSEFFSHLSSLGFKKQGGYDPTPDSLQVTKDHENLISKSETLYHPDGTTAHYEVEHGSDPKIVFHSKLEEGENKEMEGKDPCWKGYEMVGTKKKNGKEVPNCVPVEESAEQDDSEIIKSFASQSPENESEIMILSDFIKKRKMEHAKEFFHRLPEEIQKQIKDSISQELCSQLCD